MRLHLSYRLLPLSPKAPHGATLVSDTMVSDTNVARFMQQLRRMGRSLRILQKTFPYHITNRTNNKEFLYNVPQAYSIFLKQIKKASAKTDFRPHHFVLMGNHYHLVGSTPRANLSEFMSLFQTEASKAMNLRLGRRDHFFKGRFHASIIDNESYMYNVVRYVYQNPVRSNIVKDIHSYDYSSIHLYLNDRASRLNFSWDPMLASLPDKKSYLMDACSSVLLDQYVSSISEGLKKPFFHSNYFA